MDSPGDPWSLWTGRHRHAIEKLICPVAEAKCTASGRSEQFVVFSELTGAGENVYMVSRIVP